MELSVCEHKKGLIDETVFQELTKYIDTLPWYWGFKSTNNMFLESHPHWSINFDGIDKPQTEFKDIESLLPDIIKEIYQKVKKPDTMLIRCYANGITHGLAQRVHRDDSVGGAKTHIVCLNDTWKIDWGGETIIVKDRSITGSFLPTPMSILTIDGTELHGVRPISPICYELRKTLMFKTRPL